MKDAPIQPAADKIKPLTVRIPEACRITGIGRSKLYDLIAAGEIETVKIGTITLVPLESIQRLVGRGRPPAGDHTFSQRLKAAMHPTLARGIITAALAKVPQSIRCSLSELNERNRVEAEDAIVASLVEALYTSDG